MLSTVSLQSGTLYKYIKLVKDASHGAGEYISSPWRDLHMLILIYLPPVTDAYDPKDPMGW